MTQEILDLTAATLDRSLLETLAPDEKLRTCIQCGTCTASCGSAYAMEYTPRQMWRMVQLGLKDEVLNSDTFWLCSACYSCSVRCPRGIPLLEAIGALKRMAIAKKVGLYRESTNFYRVFMDVVRRYGRVDELEFMVRYFLATNPFLAIGYMPLGLAMLTHGKVTIQEGLLMTPRLMGLGGAGKLDALFRRVEELEAAQ
ncbi:MAG TPA: heterodisulfide reductase [Anaerolineae bacterium]|nr:heterodisulfide reductase [Anaerolineae bacterium]